MVFLIVTGSNKSEKVYQILEKKKDWECYPASLVNPENGDLIWLLDNLAAEKLQPLAKD